MPISKTQRWLDLISFLIQRRYPVSIDQIMGAVPAYAPKWTSGSDKDRESARRMFERDKDELRALGMPLDTVEYSIEYGTERAEGYTLTSRDFYLPYLRIIGEEAEAGRPGTSADRFEVAREDAVTAVEALRRVADLPGFGLAAEARSALRKVAFDLEVDELENAPVLYVERAGTTEVRERMALLADAVRSRKKVRFTYHGIYRGEPTERSVAPFGLLFQHGHWYLIGHDDARDDIRVFRLGRMEEVELNRRAARTADFDVPADFEIGDYTQLEAWEVGAGDEVGLTARVRFEFPASLWAARNEYGELVNEEGGGAALRDFDVHQVGPFLRWLQSFAGEAVVISPPELRGEQVSLAQQTAALYGEVGRG